MIPITTVRGPLLVFTSKMKGDKCLLTSFDLICHIGQTPKKEKIKKKHTVRERQDVLPLAVLVLEYQHNTGSQNCSFGSTKFMADIL